MGILTPEGSMRPTSLPESRVQNFPWLNRLREQASMSYQGTWVGTGRRSFPSGCRTILAERGNSDVSSLEELVLYAGAFERGAQHVAPSYAFDV